MRKGATAISYLLIDRANGLTRVVHTVVGGACGPLERRPIGGIAGGMCVLTYLKNWKGRRASGYIIGGLLSGDIYSVRVTP